MAPAILDHMTEGAVGNRGTEIARPLADEGMCVIPLIGPDRVESQAVPAVPVVSRDALIGARKGGNAGEFALPGALAEL